MENTKTRKMTLADYLARRGAVKALTSLEADVFGVPFPLVGGWARAHGAIEITNSMIETLRGRIGCAPTATTKKAQQGLDAVLGIVEPAKASSGTVHRIVPWDAPKPPKAAPVAFRGFALRGERAAARVGLPWE